MKKIRSTVMILGILPLLSSCLSKPTTSPSQSLPEEPSSSEAIDSIDRNRSEIKESENVRNRKRLIQTAQLNEEQVENLEDLDGVPVRSDGQKGIFKVILPGYIPQGYSLHSVKFRKKEPNSEGFYTPIYYYSITYKNSNSQCFLVGALIPPSGGPIEVGSIDVYSPALGNLSLIYSEFDSSSDQSRVFLDSVKGQPDGFVYIFGSPTSGQSCKTVSLQDAIKVVESLDFLNPQPIAKSFPTATPTTPEGDFNAEIIDPPTNCRTGVGTDNPVQQALQKGDTLVNRDAPQTDGKGGTWYREQYLDCWIHESQLRFK